MVASQRSQAAHSSLDSAVFVILTAIASWLSTNCIERPCEACHAIWQCISQEPGLSLGKAIAR